MVSVIGETEANAKSKISSLGLNATVVYEEDTSKDNGVVLKQSVNSGTTVNEGTSVTITVNKIAETKSITATINVKAITGGYTEEKEEKEGNNTATSSNTTTQSTTVKVVITVGGTTVYSDSNVDKNTTNKQATISGKGTADVVLTITDNNGGNWVRTQSVNFNNSTSISFQ